MSEGNVRVIKQIFLPDSCDDPVCSCLTQSELRNYALVCLDTHRAVQAYSGRAFRLRHSIVKFVDDKNIQRFRNVMRRTGTLISGSVALHYFARTLVGDADLDLYTQGQHAPELFNFIRSLGYTYKERESQDKNLDKALHRAVNMFAVRDDAIYDQRAILDAFTFVRGDAVIQVMIAAETAIDTVLDFHSTVVMNVISFRAAYSLYPFNTFVKRAGVRFIDDHGDGPISKYTSRGWRLSSIVSSKQFDRMGKEMTGTTRYVGDKSTWIIDLDDNAPNFPDPVLFNSWHLHWTYRPGVFIMPEIRRLLYVGPRSWTQNRVFANHNLLKDFNEATMGIDTSGATDADILAIVLKSASYTLFNKLPPSSSDTRYTQLTITTRPMRSPVVTNLNDSFDADLPREYANPSLLRDPANVPVEMGQDDDIVFVGMTFNPVLRNPALRHRIRPRVHANNGVGLDNDETHVPDYPDSPPADSPPLKKARRE